jgi:hypothetical protein
MAASDPANANPTNNARFIAKSFLLAQEWARNLLSLFCIRIQHKRKIGSPSKKVQPIQSLLPTSQATDSEPFPHPTSR